VDEAGVAVADPALPVPVPPVTAEAVPPEVDPLDPVVPLDPEPTM
jgi:hypothetical protein